MTSYDIDGTFIHRRRRDIKSHLFSYLIKFVGLTGTPSLGSENVFFDLHVVFP